MTTSKTKSTKIGKPFIISLVLLWILSTIAFWNQYELSNKVAELRTGLEFNTKGGEALEDNLSDVRERIKFIEYKVNENKILSALIQARVEYQKDKIQFVRILEDGSVLLEANYGTQNYFIIKVKETENSFIITRQ